MMPPIEYKFSPAQWRGHFRKNLSRISTDYAELLEFELPRSVCISKGSESTFLCQLIKDTTDQSPNFLYVTFGDFIRPVAADIPSQILKELNYPVTQAEYDELPEETKEMFRTMRKDYAQTIPNLTKGFFQLIEEQVKKQKFDFAFIDTRQLNRKANTRHGYTNPCDEKEAVSILRNISGFGMQLIPEEGLFLFSEDKKLQEKMREKTRNGEILLPKQLNRLQLTKCPIKAYHKGGGGVNRLVNFPTTPAEGGALAQHKDYSGFSYFEQVKNAALELAKPLGFSLQYEELAKCTTVEELARHIRYYGNFGRERVPWTTTTMFGKVTTRDVIPESGAEARGYQIKLSKKTARINGAKNLHKKRLKKQKKLIAEHNSRMERGKELISSSIDEICSDENIREFAQTLRPHNVDFVVIGGFDEMAVNWDEQEDGPWEDVAVEKLSKMKPLISAALTGTGDPVDLELTNWLLADEFDDDYEITPPSKEAQKRMRELIDDDLSAHGEAMEDPESRLGLTYSFLYIVQSLLSHQTLTKAKKKLTKAERDRAKKFATDVKITRQYGNGLKKENEADFKDDDWEMPERLKDYRTAVENFQLVTGNFLRKNDLKEIKIVGGRAGASKDDKLIEIGLYDSGTVMFHEMAHHIEFNSHAVFDACQAFLLSKAAKSPAGAAGDLVVSSMNDQQNEFTYRDDESTVVGNFSHPYIGRFYESGFRNSDDTIQDDVAHSSEVLTMTLQHLYNPAAGRFMLNMFRKQLKDHRDELEFAVAMAEEIQNKKFKRGNYEGKGLTSFVGNPRIQQIDTEYESAFKNGDLEAMQTLVNEAAQAAGYTEKLYRGFRRRPKTADRWRTTEGRATVSLTPVKEVANLYSHSPTFFGIKQKKGAKVLELAVNTEDFVDLRDLGVRATLYDILRSCNLTQSYMPLHLTEERYGKNDYMSGSQSVFTAEDLKYLIEELDQRTIANNYEFSGWSDVSTLDQYWNQIDDMLMVDYEEWQEEENDKYGEQWMEKVNLTEDLEIDVYCVMDCPSIKEHAQRSGVKGFIHKDTAQAAANEFQRSTVAGRDASEVEGIDVEDEYSFDTFRPFEMEQCKLAQAVVYDGETGEMIPPSQRFQLDNPDIRHAALTDESRKTRGFTVEWVDPEESDFIGDMYDVAKAAGINILSHMEPASVILDDNGKVVGAAFNDFDQNDEIYSFDIAIDREAKLGIAALRALLDAVEKPDYSLLEMYPNLRIQPRVTNARLEQYLLRRGYQLVDRLSDGSSIMELPTDVSERTLSEEEKEIKERQVKKMKKHVGEFEKYTKSKGQKKGSGKSMMYALATVYAKKHGSRK